MAPLPLIFRIRQKFDRPQVDNIPLKVEEELNRMGLSEQLASCKTLAIAVGSRGITDHSLIIRAIVDYARTKQVEPFIVPAMGSHGGATAAGQLELLAANGITEEICGCPIRSSMETSLLLRSSEGYPLHIDQAALEADATLLLARIKPHTTLSGTVQSGLLKMLLIGLGNHEGAKTCHQAMQETSFDTFAQNAAEKILAKSNVIAGLALIENAYKEIAHIEAVPSKLFVKRDAALLKQSAQAMPKLPFLKADILLVDKIGKNISGVGMDSNIIGRKKGAPKGSLPIPTIQKILIRSLSEETGGNAMGIGLADFCLTQVIDAMDEAVTQVNSTTAHNLAAAVSPPHYNTDKELLAAAVQSLEYASPHDLQMQWISNTLDLIEVECSLAYWEEAQRREDIAILHPPRPLQFDAQGNLPPSR